MISRQCLQSQVTDTPWNCFLRRASTKACHATVPHLATISIYALTLQGVFNSLEPHAHGEAQVDDFWQEMLSRQCLQSQVTGTPWNCFLRRASTKACHYATSCHYFHLCPNPASIAPKVALASATSKAQPLPIGSPPMRLKRSARSSARRDRRHRV